MIKTGSMATCQARCKKSHSQADKQIAAFVLLVFGICAFLVTSLLRVPCLLYEIMLNSLSYSLRIVSVNSIIRDTCVTEQIIGLTFVLLSPNESSS